MGIAKQAFYEGAALHQLARASQLTSLKYNAPFFVLNGDLLAYLKYSTKIRSPWGFTFTEEEQKVLHRQGTKSRIAIGLVCGGDGIAAIGYEDFAGIAVQKNAAIHVACYRKHKEHYEVSGPDGVVSRKIAPSDWLKLLD